MAKKNAIFIEWLQEMREEEEPESNKYMVLNKAFNSLKKEAREYSDPDSLIAVKYIGPKIVSELKKRWTAAGRGPAGGELPPKLPSPGKRKRSVRTSDLKPPGGPKRQLLREPESDLEDTPNALHRHTSPTFGSRPYAGVPLEYSATAQYPLGVNLQIHQPYLVNPQPIYYPIGPNASVAPNAYFPPHPSLGPVPLNPLPPPPRPSAQQPFRFFYIGEGEAQVLSYDKALVDIEAGAVWYKVCFLDCPASRRHPLRQRVRLDAYENRARTRGDDPVRAWIREDDVEQFGVHVAPGLDSGMDVDDVGTSQSAVGHANSPVVGATIAANRSGEALGKAKDESLGGLLRAESKKKRKTIDPTRVLETGKEWDVCERALGKVIKKEETRTQQDVSPQISMRQRLEVAAMARRQLSSAVPGPSSLSSQSQTPRTLAAGSTPYRNNILPGYPRGSDAGGGMLYAPPETFLWPEQLNTSVPNMTTAPRDVAHSKPEMLKPTVSAPAVPPPALAAAAPKSKPKGRVRGRVSEFAPALPAVDEFDVHLDRQAAMHAAYAPALHTASGHLVDDVADLTAATALPFPAFEPIVWPPGSFDVALVLDSREVKSQRSRDYIEETLQQRGVAVLRRSLALGDVLWVARRRGVSGAGGAEGSECVLDYILERKRLDDLCLSIKDGRFREQKFRLANTALKVFYLIEDYDVQKNREVFGVQIDTARSSTQIVDGFIVKETKKLSSTIDFLVMMHRTIVEEYQNKTLYMIPPHLIKRHSYMALQKHLRNSQPTMRYLTSYACFERLSSKSGNLTARDLFAKMLLCVNGLSAEKVSTIITKYPTFRSLWEAFQAAEEEEREGRRLQEEEAALAAEQGKKWKGKKKQQKVAKAEEMLCDLEASGRQRIGPVRSAKVYHLMRANSYGK